MCTPNPTGNEINSAQEALQGAAHGIFVICQRCRAQASGANATHCPTCHRTFGGPTGFDLHRSNGECLDPAVKGYREVTRNGWTRWIKPPSEADLARLNSIR